MNSKAIDGNSPDLLEQVILRLRQEPVPELPDLEIVFPTDMNGKVARPSSSRLTTAARLTAALFGPVSSSRFASKTRIPRRPILTIRIAASVLLVTGLAGLGLLLVLGANSVLAQTALAIRDAKNCRFEMKQTMQVNNAAGPGEVEIRTTVYWKAPDLYRVEFHKDDESPFVQIVFPNKPGLWISKKDKEYRRLPVSAGRELPMMRIIQLGRFSGKPDRDLGVKKTDGVDTRGFEIALNRLDSTAPTGTLAVWVSDELRLPVLVEYRAGVAGQTIAVSMQDFKWNTELDESLFDTTPPKGYVDTTPGTWQTRTPTTTEYVKTIVAGLRFYAEFFDGKYPAEIDLSPPRPGHGSTTSQALAKKVGIIEPQGKIEPELRVKFSEANMGLIFLDRVLRENRPAKYYGNTVTPRDADKLLLYWKVDDGFQVVFGDLKTRKVSAEELERVQGRNPVLKRR